MSKETMSTNEEIYLISEKTGDRFRLDGCRRSSQRYSTTPRFGSARLTSNSRHRFPPSVDLRRLMTPVEHQGILSSCVGNALVGAIEFLIKRDTGKHIDISRLFVYYNARSIYLPRGEKIEDIGVPIESAIEALKKFGSCKENLHPYKETLVNEKPAKICYDEGKSYRLTSFESIDSNLNEMKCCLADGYPFVFGLDCFSSFDQSETNGGFVSTPKFHRNEQSNGSHAMLAVGYSDQKQVFIVRNSYGDQWGDRGYIYIPYDYMSHDRHCFDRFAIKSFSSKNENQIDETSIVEYNPNIDYSILWPTDENFDHYDPNAFWYDESYFIDLKFDFDSNSNSNSIDWSNISNEIYFGSSSAMKMTTTRNRIQRIDKNEKRKEQFRILWIDRQTNENIQLAKAMEKLFGIEMNFVEKYSDGEKYLNENKENLRFSFRFLIVCRGFYSDEKKNAMNLHEYLYQLKLGRIPILIYTNNRTNLIEHFQKQSEQINFSQWKSRFEIIDDENEFMSKIKFYFEK